MHCHDDCLCVLMNRAMLVLDSWAWLKKQAGEFCNL